jgi:hypothetical protein
MTVVESAHGVDGGALGQRTWHMWCSYLINRYTSFSRTLVVMVRNLPDQLSIDLIYCPLLRWKPNCFKLANALETKWRWNLGSILSYNVFLLFLASAVSQALGVS